jgi:hypothetical protein
MMKRDRIITSARGRPLSEQHGECFCSHRRQRQLARLPPTERCKERHQPPPGRGRDCCHCRTSSHVADTSAVALVDAGGEVRVRHPAADQDAGGSWMQQRPLTFPQSRIVQVRSRLHRRLRRRPVLVRSRCAANWAALLPRYKPGVWASRQELAPARECTSRIEGMWPLRARL